MHIARQGGVRALLNEVRSFVINQNDTFDNLYYRYLRQRRSVPLSINNTTIQVHIGDRHDYRAYTFFRKAEQHLAQDLVRELRPDDIVWDVGANFGLYSCLVEVAPVGSAIAFEPLPENIRRMRKNFRLNDANAEIVESALWDSNGSIRFSPASDGNLGGASVDTNNNGQEVKTQCGDALDVSSPSVVKIDVEGAEQLVIDGMKQRLSDADCRLVYCELHHSDQGASIEDFGSTPSQLQETLQDVGFTVEILEERQGQTQIKGVK